jgi:hypothetical protein
VDGLGGGDLPLSRSAILRASITLRLPSGKSSLNWVRKLSREAKKPVGSSVAKTSSKTKSGL